MRRVVLIAGVAVIAVLAMAPVHAQDYQNAGVFPYSTASGEMKVLLGFDPGENAWADFVGVCTPGESPAQTAAREFTEETREAFPYDRVLGRLEDLQPMEVGPTRIYMLEVPQTSATLIGRLTRGRNTEKTLYCWVPVAELLRSVDDRGPKRARVPASCGGASDDLFDLVGANLESGKVLRLMLEQPDALPPANLGMAPRCGR